MSKLLLRVRLHVRARGDHRLADDLLDLLLLGEAFASLGALGDFDAGFAVPSRAFAAGQVKRQIKPEGA